MKREDSGRSSALRSAEAKNAMRIVRAAALKQIRLVKASAFTEIDSPASIDGLPIMRFSHDGEAIQCNCGEFRVLAKLYLEVIDEETAEADTNGDAFVKDPFVLVTAEFELLYKLPEEFEATDEELEAFASLNGVFNAWPYFREFVQSMITRMGLPVITIPLFRMPSKKGSGGVMHAEQSGTEKRETDRG